jgi:hypothetical protein
MNLRSSEEAFEILRRLQTTDSPVEISFRTSVCRVTLFKATIESLSSSSLVFRIESGNLEIRLPQSFTAELLEVSSVDDGYILHLNMELEQFLRSYIRK